MPGPLGLLDGGDAAVRRRRVPGSDLEPTDPRRHVGAVRSRTQELAAELKQVTGLAARDPIWQANAQRDQYTQR